MDSVRTRIMSMPGAAGQHPGPEPREPGVPGASPGRVPVLRQLPAAGTPVPAAGKPVLTENVPGPEMTAVPPLPPSVVPPRAPASSGPGTQDSDDGIAAHRAPPVAPMTNKYPVGASVRADHPEWSIYATGPVRPPTAEEAAEYERRASDPDWADIYGDHVPPDMTAVHAPPLPEPQPDSDAAADRVQHQAQDYLTRLGADTADLADLARD